MSYKIGLEYEYMLLDVKDKLLYFDNTDYSLFDNLLSAESPDEQAFSSKHQGQKGYWYLEGDERFNHNGKFTDLKIKGIEIRTPPLNSVQESILFLLAKEKQLSEQLATKQLKLAIAAHNPFVERYQFTPPLNQWELKMRNNRPEYLLSEISNVSYGPDINLSFHHSPVQEIIDQAEKLNYYAPYIVPFSFSSPFHLSKQWPGLSWRSWTRRNLRPTCKAYIHNKTLSHPSLYPAIHSQQHGRIEFKAFDAIPMIDILYACCYLLLGLCLDKTLPGRTSKPDGDLYQKAALQGFSDNRLYSTCNTLLYATHNALQQNGINQATEYIDILFEILKEKRYPANILIEEYQKTGKMFFIGGLLNSKTWRQANAQ